MSSLQLWKQNQIMKFCVKDIDVERVCSLLGTLGGLRLMSSIVLITTFISSLEKWGITARLSWDRQKHDAFPASNVSLKNVSNVKRGRKKNMACHLITLHWKGRSSCWQPNRYIFEQLVSWQNSEIRPWKDAYLSAPSSSSILKICDTEPGRRYTDSV